MKHTLAIGLCCCLLGANVVSAQVVTVTGVGQDRSGALNDARRNAVSQVVGTYINSRTISRDAQIAIDEIYAKSVGYVKKIDILEEDAGGNSYRIKARIDVDTNPNSELTGKLALLTALNDPKITVEVTYAGNSENSDMATYCENLIVEELLQQGFRHVMERGETVQEIGADGENNILTSDYQIIGRIDGRAAEIFLPKYADYTNEDNDTSSVKTGLSKATAHMDVKIIKTDTKDIIGEFRVTGDALKDSDDSAERSAITNLASQAAKEVRKIFGREGARADGNVEIIARSEDQNAITEFAVKLKTLPGVHNVNFRNYANGKGTLAIDTELNPAQVFRMLKEKSPGIFMESLSANVLEISL